MVVETKIFRLPELIIQLQDSPGHSVGLITGCFDFLHSEHIDLFEFAKKHVDTLVVALETDTSISLTKGYNRPSNNIFKRANALSQIPFVDYVLLLESNYHHTSIEHNKYLDIVTLQIKPKYIVTSKDNDIYIQVKKDRAKLVGCKLLLDTRKRKVTSTKILKNYVPKPIKKV